MKNLCAVAILSALLAEQATAVPILSFTTPTTIPSSGSAFDVGIDVSNIADLYAYQFSVQFDPNVLQATAVTESSFLSSGGATFFVPGAIDNLAGTVNFTGDTLIDFIPGVTGTGRLANLGFSYLGGSSSYLTFGDVIFLDSALSDIELVTINVTASVPLPGSLALFSTGFLVLIHMRRFNRPRI